MGDLSTMLLKNELGKLPQKIISQIPPLSRDGILLELEENKKIVGISGNNEVQLKSLNFFPNKLPFTIIM